MVWDGRAGLMGSQIPPTQLSIGLCLVLRHLPVRHMCADLSHSSLLFLATPFLSEAELFADVVKPVHLAAWLEDLL